MEPTPDRVLRRVFDRIRIEGDCWLSDRSTIRGYPQIGWGENGKNHMRLAHRVAWEAVNGPIPNDMTVDHICHVRRCINPDHLRLLSNFENARRTYGRDWPLGQCVNGHPNSEMVQVTNQRRCRECHKIRMQRWNRLATVKRRAAKAERLATTQ